jgi:predicted phage terminase large subunit-like protein
VDSHSRAPGVIFIPSRWRDDPHLDRDAYLQQLAHLPPTERERLVNGDWEIGDEGEMFRREWFELVDRAAVPEHTRAVRYWDFASSTPTLANPDPDYTVGLRLDRHDRTGTFYITGLIRVRLHAGQVEQLVRATAEQDRRTVQIWLEQEPGASAALMADHFKRHVLAGYAVHTQKPSGPKDIRAQVVAAAAENGLIKLVPGPHTAAFLDEVAAFPHTAHDDCVDALAGAHTALIEDRPRIVSVHAPRGRAYERHDIVDALHRKLYGWGV